MTQQRRISFGIKTAQGSYGDVLDVWQEADEIPEIEHAWLWDHMIPLREPLTAPQLEGWTLLAALAAGTRRLRFGLMVSNNQNRHPALLAKMAATIDVISNGRLILGIGAGAPGDIARREYEAYGVPLRTAGDAIRRLDEALGLIKRLWTEPEFDHDGAHYPLRGVICEPKPVQSPHPPVLVGGAGEQLTLRVVARHASAWNFPGPPWATVEEFRHKSAVLDRHCAGIGRDPSEIERQVYVLMDSRDTAAARDAILPLIEAGATQVVLADRAPHEPGKLRRLVDEVINPLSVHTPV